VYVEEGNGLENVERFCDPLHRRVVQSTRRGLTLRNGAISCEALDDHFGTDGLDNAGRVEAFQKNRSTIESLVRRKYLSWPVEEPEYVLVKTMEIERLSIQTGKPLLRPPWQLIGHRFSSRLSQRERTLRGASPN
jgi:Protein of unknown function (DUF1488)